MTSKVKWTWMVYLAGDNDLSQFGDTDLEEMRRVGSSADVNVVVQFDNAGNLGTRRIKIERDGQKERVEKMGETDSGDPNQLVDFTLWAAQEYPADRYALILWNHGGGWAPSAIDEIAQEVHARDYSARESNERAASPLGRTFFRTSLKKILNVPTNDERAILSDDGSGHSVDTVELGKVLALVKKKLGKRIDLLGMDACLMSNLEVAFQCKSYVRYIVASEETEPGDGWPYTDVLRVLVDRPSAATAEIAAHIVDSYIASYEQPGSTPTVTQTALDLSKIETLASPLDELADALNAALPKARGKMYEAQQRAANFAHNTLWDPQPLLHRVGQVHKEQSCDQVSHKRCAGCARARHWQVRHPRTTPRAEGQPVRGRVDLPAAAQRIAVLQRPRLREEAPLGEDDQPLRKAIGRVWMEYDGDSIFQQPGAGVCKRYL